ncbi:GNAT family N-acetyltransferase [Leucobacter sp. HY1910]
MNPQLNTALAGITALIEHSAAEWNARDATLDPQLPDRDVKSGGEFLVEFDPHGIAAGGVRTRVSVDPGAPEAIWGAAEREDFALRWDGEPGPLGALLDAWLTDAATASWRTPNPWDTALTLTAPARDSALAIPLLERGFALVGVAGIRIGARGASEARARDALTAAGLWVRPASAADLDLLAELDSELLAHDAQHGSVTVRQGAQAVLRAMIAERLAQNPSWTWIVEDETGAAGYLSIEIDAPRHRAMCAEGGSIAHLQAMYLRPRVRGGGLGEALVEFGHARIEAVGIERVQLDYAALNPRSGPFWCRMGYRPLWHHWQRRPAKI